MKLKFELRRAYMEHLYKLLQMLESQIWSGSDAHRGTKDDLNIYFYFDTDNVIIYPEERGGFDKVFARLHIQNRMSLSAGDSECGFFQSYTIRSMKEKSAVLLTPKKLSSFIEDLKVLVDLGLDGSFRLAQQNDPSRDNAKTQYIEIQGVSQQSTGAVFRSYVEIETIFSQQYYPEALEQKEIDFVIDANTCSQVFNKFSQRIQILSDEEAQIHFVNAENKVGDRSYELALKSQHMESRVTSCLYEGTLRAETDQKREYFVTLKKEVFKKFFLVLKNSGQANLRINDQALVEMMYQYEKCPYLSVSLETASRSI